MAEQSVAVFLGPVGQVGDEGFDLFPRGLAQGLDPTEIGCIGLDQGGVELMLANQLAETIADLGAAVVPVAIGRLRLLPRFWTRMD
ncbi:MAG: hypothetical protein ACLPOO_08675 [Terriglobales bacterium]